MTSFEISLAVDSECNKVGQACCSAACPRHQSSGCVRAWAASLTSGSPGRKHLQMCLAVSRSLWNPWPPRPKGLQN